MSDESKTPMTWQEVVFSVLLLGATLYVAHRAERERKEAAK